MGDDFKTGGWGGGGWYPFTDYVPGLYLLIANYYWRAFFYPSILFVLRYSKVFDLTPFPFIRFCYNNIETQ